jgi:hypothetical protein
MLSASRYYRRMHQLVRFVFVVFSLSPVDLFSRGEMIGGGTVKEKLLTPLPSFRLFVCL